MIPITSAIEGSEFTYAQLRDQLEAEDFSLGGGYKYDHGYFDKALDDEESGGNRYYLRIPAYATNGDLDEPETVIQLGKPFVIKHEFRTTTNDLTGDIGVATALINQFSKPIPTDDAKIDDKWIERAKSSLDTIEQILLQ